MSSESSCSGVCMWSCYANWFCVMWKALAYRAFRSILSTCRVTARRQLAWNPTWKLRKHSWSTESCSFLWRSSTSFEIKVEGHVDSPEQFAKQPFDLSLFPRCWWEAVKLGWHAGWMLRDVPSFPFAVTIFKPFWITCFAITWRYQHHPTNIPICCTCGL